LRLSRETGRESFASAQGLRFEYFEALASFATFATARGLGARRFEAQREMAALNRRLNRFAARAW